MERNNLWDWLKLLAFVLMCISHIAFVYPGFTDNLLFLVGRPCFPIFGIIAGFNFANTADPGLYLAKLIPYAVVSEPAFYLLTGQFGNIILQILLGFSFAKFGNLIFALACSFCAFGIPGLVALVLWSDRSSLRKAILGGLIVNPLPYGFASFLGSFLPFAQNAKLPMVPLWLRNFGAMYVAHLYLFASWKLLK